MCVVQLNAIFTKVCQQFQAPAILPHVDKPGTLTSHKTILKPGSSSAGGSQIVRY